MESNEHVAEAKRYRANREGEVDSAFVYRAMAAAVTFGLGRLIGTAVG